jgi:hypothetical protein
MRKLIIPIMWGASALATITTSQASDALSIAVYGDSPYGLNDADTAQYDATPTFIKTINDDPDVSLVLHAGDIHSGKQICSYNYDKSIYELPPDRGTRQHRPHGVAQAQG